MLAALTLALALAGPPPMPAPIPGTMAPSPSTMMVPPPSTTTPTQPAPLVQPRPAGAIYSPIAEPGAGLRRYGLGATIIGVVLGIGAGIAATTNPCGKDGASGSDCRSDIRNAVAMTMGVAGFGLLSGGVIAMSFGEAQRRRAKLGHRASLQVTGFGVTLRFGRF